MTFRRKLLIVFALTVFLSVAAVALLVLAVTRNAFEKTENQRTAALVTQFQREFTRRGEEVARRVEAIAGSEPVSRMATALNGAPLGHPRTPPNISSWRGKWRKAVNSTFWNFWTRKERLFLRRSGRRSLAIPTPAFESLSASSGQDAFLKREELQDSTALGLFAVRATRVGEHPVYVVGGQRLDKNFLSALDLPADMRVLLYQNRGDHFSADSLLDPSSPGNGSDVARPAEKFAPLIDAVRQYNQEMSGIVQWSSDQADDEVFHAIPLRGVGKDRPLLAYFAGGKFAAVVCGIEAAHSAPSALLVGGGGIILAILLSSWAAARVTRPVEQLARAAQDVAAGNWDTRVEVTGRDEIAQLAESFNRMTAELLAQKERLVQTERVAAWRELARRLAHELKNPLFPLQLTVENLMRARTQSPEQFEEVFHESSQHSAGRDFESEDDHRALQRIFENAASAVAGGAGE